MEDSVLSRSLTYKCEDGAERIVQVRGYYIPSGNYPRGITLNTPYRLPSGCHPEQGSLFQCMGHSSWAGLAAQQVEGIPSTRAPTTYPLYIRISPSITTGERGRWPETSLVKPLFQWLDWLTCSLTRTTGVRVTRTGVRLRSGAKTLSTKTTNTTRVS